ncbi:MAG TPA: LCP family protein [Candidatus Saccharimonadales bacterium]|jgi:LCP family protein required for cell wall assembly
MDSNSRRPGHNIDGFITSRNGRDAAGGKLDDRLRAVRTRQPGFHVQPPVRRDFTAPSVVPTAQRTNGIQSGIVLPPIYRSGQHTPGKLATPAAARSKRARRHPRLRKVAERTTAVLAILVLLTTGWLGWKVFHNSSKVFGSNSNLLGFLSATPLKCENTGRCNILLAGNSADDPGHDGANLTDSIMIVSIDLKNNTAFMISVPRDLYVNIPGSGYGKINEAYPDGQSDHFSQAGYAKGGMGLLEETVSQSFGIPISNYALVDYSALRDAVNAVGGINVDIRSSDPRGLYDPSIDYATKGPLVKLTNGWHKLNGEQALDLARSRGDTYGSYGFAQSDFERTQNQRMMILALKSKIMTSSVLVNPIKLGELFDAFGNNVHTDLTTGNIRRLYDISRQINSSNIKSVGLNDVSFGGQKNVDLLNNYSAPNGESALIPAAGLGDYSQIQLYLKQLTSNDPVVKESADVVVLNAGSIDGLATKEETVLAGKGMDVSAVADAPAQQANNRLVDNSKGKDPATLAELKSLFGDSTATNASLSTTYPNADFIVVLGQSQKMPQ